jgi:hypothetical protein
VQDKCAGAAVGNVGKALTIFFFFLSTSYDTKPLMCAFFLIVFQYVDESTLFQIVKQNTPVVFEYTINKTI